MVTQTYPILSRPSSLMNTDFSTSIMILAFSDIGMCE